MIGTKFILLIMLTYAVLPQPVQVRSIGNSNTCPADYLPSGKDSKSCSIKIADTESLTTFLKQKTVWQDGYVQHARISIAIVGNVTDNTAPAPKDWIISYIDPSGPFYYVSWRSDFKVLSFGLLDDKPDQKINIDIVENGNNNCTIQRSNKEITSQVVEYLTKEIRKANVTDNDEDYANIDLCFLAKFTWFIESPWYNLKKYFGVPFQEFGYRCCNYFNGTVCCDDKLKEMEGYRIVPYIMSVIIFCYTPLLIVRIGNLFTVFHPRHWYAADKQDHVADKKKYISMFGNVFFSEDSTEDPNETKCKLPTFLTELMVRKFRIVFILLLPTAIYIELCMYASAYEWKAHIQDIAEDDMLFGFTSMLGDPLDTSFLSLLGGPLVALIIYHVLGVLLLILPKNFETDVIERGTCHCITGFICKIAPQGCNLQGYKKFERVLKTGIYLWFNCNFWTGRENTKNAENSGNSQSNKKYEKCIYLWCKNNTRNQNEAEKSPKSHEPNGLTRDSNQNEDDNSPKPHDVEKSSKSPKCNDSTSNPNKQEVEKSPKSPKRNDPTSNLNKHEVEKSPKSPKSNDPTSNPNKHEVEKSTKSPKRNDSASNPNKHEVEKSTKSPKCNDPTSNPNKHEVENAPKSPKHNDPASNPNKHEVEKSPKSPKPNDSTSNPNQMDVDTSTQAKESTCSFTKCISTVGKRGCLLMFLPFPIFPFYFVILNGGFRYILYGPIKDKSNIKKVVLIITFLMLVTFLYITSVIISYSIYLFVYIIYFMCLALVTSPKQTATYLVFVFWGIVFIFQMFKDALNFYKDIFDLTLKECENNFKTRVWKDGNCVVYLERKVARFVQQKIRPFYVEVGQMVFKTVIVGFAYAAALVFLTNYSLAISDVLQNITTLVTGALPSIIQSQIKPERPKNCVIEFMVKCYENEETEDKKK